MTLVKWNNAFPNLFEDVFQNNAFDTLAHKNNLGTLPAVNIKENNEAFEVEVAVPGLRKEDFSIHLENNVLSISAEKETKEEKKEEKYTRREFSYSSFKRVFTLPDSVQSDKIAAHYKEGILNILIPKREEAKTKPARLISIE